MSAPLCALAPFISLKDLWSGVTLRSTAHSHSEGTRCLSWYTRCIWVVIPLHRIIVADIVFRQQAHISHKQNISNNKCKALINTQMSTIRLLQWFCADFWMRCNWNCVLKTDWSWHMCRWASVNEKRSTQVTGLEQKCVCSSIKPLLWPCSLFFQPTKCGKNVQRLQACSARNTEPGQTHKNPWLH